MRRPVALLATVQVVLALVLVVVAWYGVDRSRQLEDLFQAALADVVVPTVVPSR